MSRKSAFELIKEVDKYANDLSNQMQSIIALALHQAYINRDNSEAIWAICESLIIQELSLVVLSRNFQNCREQIAKSLPPADLQAFNEICEVVKIQSLVDSVEE